jgi:hypothetical protein
MPNKQVGFNWTHIKYILKTKVQLRYCITEVLHNTRLVPSFSELCQGWNVQTLFFWTMPRLKCADPPFLNHAKAEMCRPSFSELCQGWNVQTLFFWTMPRLKCADPPFLNYAKAEMCRTSFAELCQGWNVHREKNIFATTRRVPQVFATTSLNFAPSVARSFHSFSATSSSKFDQF